MLRTLAERIASFVDEGSYAYLLDRETTVPADAPLVAFDTRKVPRELSAAVLFVLAEHVTARIERRGAERLREADAGLFAGRSMLVIDEAWKLVERRATGEWVNDIARRSRHLGLFLVAISQQLSDFAGPYGTRAAAQLDPAALPAPVARRAGLHQGGRAAVRRRGRGDRAAEDRQARLLAGVLDQRHPRPRHDRAAGRADRVRTRHLGPGRRPAAPHADPRSRGRRRVARARAARRRGLGGEGLMAAPALQAAGAAVAGRVARAARARRGGARAARAADADRRAARAGVLDRRRLCADHTRRRRDPAGLVPVFNEAARVYTVNAYLLASIAEQESTFGTGPGWRTVNGAGCVGLMQMCVGGAGGDSWSATKYAYRRGQRPPRYSFMTDRHPDVLDSFDNVMAAAVHLRGKVGGRPIPNLDGARLPGAVRLLRRLLGRHRRQLRRRRPRARPHLAARSRLDQRSAARRSARPARWRGPSADRSRRRSASAAPGRPATPASTSASPAARRSSPRRPDASRSSSRPAARAATATSPAFSTPAR